jgi:hypothetical protein
MAGISPNFFPPPDSSGEMPAEEASYWLVGQKYVKYARDGKRPDLWMLLFTNIDDELYCYSNEFPNHLFY